MVPLRRSGVYDGLYWDLKDPEQEQAIKEIIDRAKKKVERLARTARRVGDFESNQILE
jgi:hypothetical protein